jgi:glucarate dehydratase
MHITDLEAYTVAIPFTAPIRSAFGVSYPARIRTCIRVHTDAGIVGLGETGPSALRTVNRDALLPHFEQMVKPAIMGLNPFEHETIRRRLRYSPQSIAVEIACWDIMAQAAGLPLYKLLGGGATVPRVPLSAYCFYRLPAQAGSGAVTPENMVAHCQRLQQTYGFTTLKLKLGAHHPFVDVPVLHQLRAAVGPDIELRIDPNGSWSLPTALRMVKKLEGVDLQYIEEPVRAPGPGDSTTALTELRRLRSITATPIAADHTYRLDLLTAVIRADTADVTLADVFGCGGIARTMQFCRMAAAFGLGLALHSGAELCIGQVAKLHIHAALHESIRYAGDAIYPEYVDGVLQGGPLPIVEGHMAVPQTPGLGVQLDPDRLARWELTAERQHELDQFWQDCKARIGIDYATEDDLVRHD